VTTGDTRLRRAYQTVNVERSDDGFVVRLDDRPLKTPRGAAMRLPSQALAEAVAAEWRAQGVRPDLNRLPLTRIAATALDRMPSQRDLVVAELAGYAETDLLCHRASEPPALVARQHAQWQPLLDWLSFRFDAPLAATTGVLPCAQSKASLAALTRALAGLDDFRLAAVSVAVGAAGSLVIGLALAEGEIDADAAFAAAELDATFQIEQWGEDEIAARRRAGIREDLDSAARLLGLVRVSS
jgi:chaperone required for assembly of F1-ATPase